MVNNASFACLFKKIMTAFFLEFLKNISAGITNFKGKKNFKI